MKKRLAILSTHPIQYYAPLFRLLAKNVSFEVRVYFSKVTEEVRFDPDFGQDVTWDIPMTAGYHHESHSATTKTGLTNLIQSIASFQPSAILVFGWNFTGHFAVMKHFHGKTRIWFRGDSTLIDPLPIWKKWMRKAWLTWVYRHVDIAFYVGKANERYYTWAGLDEAQLIHAPHAIDNDFFMKNEESRQKQALEIRRRLGIPDAAFVFLFVGKLEPKKQPLQLASAFRRFVDSDANGLQHLLFVGSGILSEQLARENRDYPQVHLAGFVNQSQMPAYYRVGNCLCLPSRGPGETWGLAVNEYLASTNGSLILSDRVGCAEDLIDECDQIVHHNSPNEWPTALYRVTQTKTINRLSSRRKLKQHTIAAFAKEIQLQMSNI